MTQRERKRLSGFCSQSLTESRPLSPQMPSADRSSGAFQLSALVSAGAKDQSHKSPEQILACQKLGTEYNIPYYIFYFMPRIFPFFFFWKILQELHLHWSNQVTGTYKEATSQISKILVVDLAHLPPTPS